jgi:predicted negative regulator of RcsB-dependent stress response
VGTHPTIDPLIFENNMATHLDLEEQEQLDQLKHFWKTYGNFISWALILVMSGFAAWNGYGYWQRTQSAKASALFDEVERAATTGDMSRLERSLGDMKDKFGSTLYAQQAALLAAKTFQDKDKLDQAKAALTWVSDNASDESYAQIARLRLVALLLQAKSYDEALQQLAKPVALPLTPLAADLRGDVLQSQGKTQEAIAAYSESWQKMDEANEYRRLIEAKLNALGVDPKSSAGVSK